VPFQGDRSKSTELRGIGLITAPWPAASTGSAITREERSMLVCSCSVEDALVYSDGNSGGSSTERTDDNP